MSLILPFVEILKQLSMDEAKILRVLSDGKHRPVVNLAAELDGELDGVQGLYVVSRNQSMLDYEAHVDHPELVPGYLDNLCRLGLAEIPEIGSLAKTELYEPLESDAPMVDLMNQIAADGKKGRFIRRFIALTEFGTVFIKACVTEPEQKQAG